MNSIAVLSSSCIMIDSADNATHSLPVTGATRLRFTDATRNIFTIDLGQDLLGDWVVTLTWSGNAMQRGGGKRLLVNDQEAGLQVLQQIAQAKQRSGFVPVLDYHVRMHRS
ncbi:hypothetical protein [Herbaspirillum sp. alder98]|uniref:hypothetical protein n=1 Tax=Herbaspirillum sp. alder98 TaxID=2913096 RepID=UPI001CD84D5E|nr:hypothetical protein [Herbaspirillum sp. alder98]MCA1326183.1 hypothetical protein [Herbaspirillum sp. alder98]